MSPALSVVIVARNEAAGLPSLLADLARRPHLLREVLVVDGGSDDTTALLARLGGATVLASPPGRGLQLCRGVAASDGDWLLLLHADARLASDWGNVVAAAMQDQRRQAWAFRLGIDGPGLALRLVEALVDLRSRWRSLPYGDQGLLIARSRLVAAGGIAPIPLMEDLELAVRLRRHQAIGVLPATLRVSDRRWRRLGVLRTTLLNARLRRDWRRGQAPELLASRYANAEPSLSGGRAGRGQPAPR
jgi:rSAM/selenodomain-associated transferase 2